MTPEKHKEYPHFKPLVAITTRVIHNYYNMFDEGVK
jgi:hypothetical protein